jgi:hypothetical protein
MQWHPYFAYLLRPLVESHFEVRTDQPVGDRPRSSDIVLLHKTAAGPPPFTGLWRRTTTWNVLEYKGPTVSARFDELHDLIELGMGIHRRLNELEAKEQRPQVDYPDVSFWYLVNHLGRRFLAEVPQYLPNVQQDSEGIWRATIFAHPVLLVSVLELPVERDSMALHVLAGVPTQARETLTEVLKAEPGLLSNYGNWLALREPEIWKEVSQMATGQEGTRQEDFTLFVDFARQTGNVKRLIETVGVKDALGYLGIKEVVDAVGANQVLASMGAEEFWAGLSPEHREELLRVAGQDKPGQASDRT